MLTHFAGVFADLCRIKYHQGQVSGSYTDRKKILGNMYCINEFATNSDAANDAYTIYSVNTEINAHTVHVFMNRLNEFYSI